MKNIGRKIGKFLFYLTYPIILIALIISGVYNFLQYREIQSVNDQFNSARDELNEESQDKQVTIDDLKQRFNELNMEIDRLEEENEELRTEVNSAEAMGLGTITGSILPFVTNSGDDLSQFQRVCAEKISNTKVQYCGTVSVLDRDYQLAIPTGEYRVYAEIFPQPATESKFYGVKAYYSEYVTCVREKNASECDQSKLTNPIKIVVNSTEVTTDVDPIDWR